ncbi:hypothetical protein N665_1663s0018 [Sinapis alba]|nr:hypothetical protein N665_1663s0018 [Sinapis alba]
MTHELLSGCKVGTLMRANLRVVTIVRFFFFFFSRVHVTHITQQNQKKRVIYLSI